MINLLLTYQQVCKYISPANVEVHPLVSEHSPL